MISTFIATRNHGQYISDAIFSCLQQDPKPGEVIVVDDASVDNTQEKVRGPSIVRYTKFEKHRGHIYAYNFGILLSQGDYVHLMAADDVLCGDFYGPALALLRKDPTVGFVFGGLQLLGENGTPTGIVRTPPLGKGIHDPLAVLKALKEVGNFICGGCVLCRREIARKEPYNSQLPFSADFLVWIRLLRKGYKAGCIPGPVYGYRQHAGQMTHQKSASKEERIICQRELDEAIHALEKSRLRPGPRCLPTPQGEGMRP